MSDSSPKIDPLLKGIAPEEVSLEEGDLARCEIDGMRPQALLRPRSTESLRAIMRIAQEEKLAVVPVGSGSNLRAANPPTRYDAAISLEKLDRILELDPANSFMRLEAGCRLSIVKEALDREGQSLPVDFPARSGRTVGGLFSLALLGPRHPYVLAPRDAALGLAAVLPGGRLVRPGGITAKNVAGYDLTRLLVGSCGSLAVLSELNLRILPHPEDRRAIEAHFPDAGAAFAFGRALSRSRLHPSFATVCAGGGHPGARALAGAEGFAVDVSYQLDRFRRDAADAGASEVFDPPVPYDDLLDEMLASASGASGDLVVRVSAPITQLHRFAEVAGSAPLVAFVPAGVIIIRTSEDEAADALGQIDRLCASVDARRHVISAPSALKRSIDAWTNVPDSYRLIQALKREFDPAWILSPGRLPGHL
ncbi:MAG: FAD-binding oxidoreductase [Planctomycetota bacterium]